MHWYKATRLLIVLAGATFVLGSLLTVARGSGGPGWAHWWCSPASLRSAVHAGGGGGIGRMLLTALEVHWPHFLPVVLGLATLVYLWRANARYASQSWPSARTVDPAPEESVA